MAQQFETLQREDLGGGLLLLTLNRPSVANALNTQMGRDLLAFFEEINGTPSQRCIVLTGAGDKAFCAGGDLKERQGMSDEAWQAQHLIFERMVRAFIACPVPVIGAINGAALGGGLCMAAACDILVTSETATIGLPEVDVGLLGGGRHAQRMFGVYKARMLMFTGQRVTGAELYRRGIVEQCVPLERLMDAAMEIAANIAEKSPLTIRMAKKNMATVEFMNIRDGYRYEQDGTNALIHTEDSKEAVRAFLEKRKPIFKNR
jgi:enoyl-CoA hydratase